MSLASEKSEIIKWIHTLENPAVIDELKKFRSKNSFDLIRNPNSDEQNFIPRNNLDFQTNAKVVQLLRYYLNNNNTTVKIRIYSNNQNPQIVSIDFPEIGFYADGNVLFDNNLNKIYFITQGYNDIFVARFNQDFLSTEEKYSTPVKIYPNPVENLINIQTEAKLQKLEIYSINGQLLKHLFVKKPMFQIYQKEIML